MVDTPMTLDEAGDLLDKYADTNPTSKPDSNTKKVEKAKEAAKKKKKKEKDGGIGMGRTRELLKEVDD